MNEAREGKFLCNPEMGWMVLGRYGNRLACVAGGGECGTLKKEDMPEDDSGTMWVGKFHEENGE